MRYKLRTIEDRKRTYREIIRLIINDVINGRLPTFHVLHIRRDDTADNHYMTPISLEPVDEKGNRALWIQDFGFLLKLMLRLKRVLEVEYNPKRPAVIFIYVDA